MLVARRGPACVLLAEFLLLSAFLLQPGVQARLANLPGVTEQLEAAQTCVQLWASSLARPGPATAGGNSSNSSSSSYNSSSRSSSSNAEWTSRRLAAVYLHAHVSAGVRDSLLACSIRRLLTRLDPSTPTDVFVFTREEAYDRLRQQLLNELGPGDAARVCLLTISRQQWHFRPRKADYQLPPWGTWSNDYLTMGLWRMLVPYSLVASLGYPFFLQIDDDLMIMDPVKVNLVQTMLETNRTMATHRMPVEYWHVMNGLPELAHFFLASNKLRPGGSLFEHVQPRNLSGLFSMQHNWWKNAKLSKDGYDLTVLFGNFMVVSTALWSDPRVQDWVTLCIQSGGLERHRWQEQGVFAFIWLLFTEPDQLWRLSKAELHWLHTRRASKLKGVCPVGSPAASPRRAQRSSSSRRLLALQ